METLLGNVEPGTLLAVSRRRGRQPVSRDDFPTSLATLLGALDQPAHNHDSS